MADTHWQLHDDERRYGTLSRFLHWSMALVLGWQFSTALAHLLLPDTAVEAFLWSTHKSVGLLLMVLVLLRGLWSLLNHRNRPPSLNAMAQLGHLALYGLMVLVPLLALLRQYGSGRAFSAFGVPLMPGSEGGAVAWMTAPGNLLHGWLGWLLLVLILGHVAMAFLHRRRAEDEDVLARMVGEGRA